jgi:hypothetical protein
MGGGEGRRDGRRRGGRDGRERREKRWEERVEVCGGSQHNSWPEFFGNFFVRRQCFFIITRRSIYIESYRITDLSHSDRCKEEKGKWSEEEGDITIFSLLSSSCIFPLFCGPLSLSLLSFFADTCGGLVFMETWN